MEDILKLKQEIEDQRKILIQVVEDNEYCFQNKDVMKKSKKMDVLLVTFLKTKEKE